MQRFLPLIRPKVLIQPSYTSFKPIIFSTRFKTVSKKKKVVKTKVAEKIPEDPKEKLQYFTENLVKYLQLKKPAKALSVFKKMKEENVPLSKEHYDLALSAASMNFDELSAIKIYNEARKLNFVPETHIMNEMMHIFVDVKNDPKKVIELFKDMEEKGPKPNEFTYYFLTAAYSDLGKMKKCRNLVEEMIEKKLPISVGILNNLVDGYVMQKNMEKAEEIIIEFKQRFKMKLNEDVFHSLMEGYASLNLFDKVYEIFEKRIEEEGIKKNSELYATIIYLLLENNNMEEALKYYNELKEKKIEKSGLAIRILAESFHKAKRGDIVKELYAEAGAGIGKELVDAAKLIRDIENKK